MAPLFPETDAPLLKTYLINRLESASEADPDVLSDYILALLRHDQAPAEVMATCITQLTDFMSSGILYPLAAYSYCMYRSLDICEGYL
jgi:hypothetical protein